MGKHAFSCASTFPESVRRPPRSALFASAFTVLLLGACGPTESPTGEAGAGGSGPDGGNRPAVALAVPAQFQEAVLTGSLAYPTAMAIAQDGRVFVCEQGGRLRVVKNGSLLSAPFLTVSVSSGGERGLLGIAFDPQFAGNRYIYVYYTHPGSPVRNRVSRFTASASNPDVAAPGSETVILELDQVSAGNHNGGALHFGPDGMLYIAVGENAVPSNSQTLDNMLGKILRINKDGTIPSDNPFYGQAAGKNRSIWALGLRNPFTFSFQPGTGRMFINDVGWDTYEEINEGFAGANYGWPGTEGHTTNPAYRAPFQSYANSGSNCAIVGSAFYNPANPTFPAGYAGDYFFGDYCGGWIRSLDLATRTMTGFATGISGLVDVQIGDDGALYYLAAGSGRLVRVTYAGGGGVPPGISAHPASVTVSAGAGATFTVTATGTSPLSYRWQRDGADIPGATGTSYTLANAQPGDNGARFRAVVGNAYGSATSNEAVLTVSSNRPPTGTITAPAAGALYQGGQTISFSGTATDPDQGSLPGSAFTWHVDFHHDTHSHPFMLPVSGSSSGSFTAFTEGETSDNVFFRLYLTVTDAGGASHRSHVDILPRKANVTLATQPPGLRITLDGAAFASPHSFTGVVGVRRTISVESPQASGGTTYAFQSWSDGGSQSHVISTPSANTTYTAAFTGSGGGGANTAPRPAILAPVSGTLFEGGQAVAFSGAASDAEEGELPPSAFTWYVEIIHGAHTHPVITALAGTRSGSFTPSTAGQANHSTGQPDPAYFYRISLKVTDAGGLVRWAYLDLQPRKSNLTLATDPAGLQVRLDGVNVATPYAFTSVVGVNRSLSAVTPQSYGDRSWAFSNWSDGGSANHVIATPAGSATYTATYR